MSEPVKRDYEAADLLEIGPLLKADAVRPGDVLLIRGSGRRSRLIALASGGYFSHAAIWMPGGDNNIGGIYLAEADGAGVGFTKIFPINLRNDDGTPSTSVYCISGNPQGCALLRHPGVGAVTLERLNEVSREVQSEAFYKTYSAYPRLLGATHLPKSLDALAKTVAHVAERARKDEGTRGTFCSELVGLFYAKLGLALFSVDRQPEEISPNSFLLNDCNLVEVQDAFLAPEMLQPGVTGYGWSYDDPRRDEGFVAMIKNRAGTDKIQASLSEFQSMTEGFARAASSLIDGASEASQKSFERHIVQVEQFGDNERADRIRRHSVSSRHAYYVISVVDRRSDAMRKDGLPEDDLKSWNEASFAMHRVAHKLISDASQALLRDSILFSLKIMRTIKRGKKQNLMESVRFARIRRSALRQWLKQKHSSREALKVVDSVLKTEVLSENSLVYVREIVEEAYQAMLHEFNWDESTESIDEKPAPRLK